MFKELSIYYVYAIVLYALVLATSVDDIAQRRSLLAEIISSVPKGDLKRVIAARKGDLRLLCAFFNNYEYFRTYDGLIGALGDVLVYRNPDGDIVDYWGRIKFELFGGIYTDKKRLLKGTFVNSLRDLLSNSKFTSIGLRQKKTVSVDIQEAQVSLLTALLSISAAERGKPLNDLLDEQCPLDRIDGTIALHRFSEINGE